MTITSTFEWLFLFSSQQKIYNVVNAIIKHPLNQPFGHHFTSSQMGVYPIINLYRGWFIALGLRYYVYIQYIHTLIVIASAPRSCFRLVVGTTNKTLQPFGL